MSLIQSETAIALCKYNTAGARWFNFLYSTIVLSSHYLYLMIDKRFWGMRIIIRCSYISLINLMVFSSKSRAYKWL